MKIFCIHGGGNEEKDNAFRPHWQEAIAGAGGDGDPEFDYLDYDALFAKAANFSDSGMDSRVRGNDKFIGSSRLQTLSLPRRREPSGGASRLTE